MRSLLATLTAALLAAATACGDSGSDANRDTSVSPDAADTSGPPLTGVILRVGSPDARSCELLVRDPDEVVGDVRFGDGVEGRFVDEGARVGVAFLRKADDAFSEGAVSLGVAGGEAAAGALTLERVTCFDSAGAPIAGATVTIQR